MSHDRGTNGKLTISYELLILFQWLVDQDASPMLRKVIQEALRSGLQKEMKKVHHGQHREQTLEEVRNSITDFFALLESLLTKEINKQNQQEAKEQRLVATLRKVDVNLCDDYTIQLSIEKTTLAMEQHPEENPENLLLQELLHQWEPPDHINVVH